MDTFERDAKSLLKAAEKQLVQKKTGYEKAVRDKEAAAKGEVAAKQDLQVIGERVQKLQDLVAKMDATPNTGTAPRRNKSGPKPSKSSSNGKTTMNKSEFVRSLPHATPAAEVVAQAKSAGLTISAAYVYAIRAAAKKAGKTPKTPKAAKKAAVKTSGKAPKAAKKVAAKAAGKRGAKPAKKAAAKKAKGRRAQKAGLKALAEGKRPLFKMALATVMGGEAMNPTMVLEALEKRGWAPSSNNPKNYINLVLNSNHDWFEKVPAKGRGFYRVLADKRGLTSAEPAAKAPKADTKAKEDVKPAAESKPAPKAVSPSADEVLAEIGLKPGAASAEFGG